MGGVVEEADDEGVPVVRFTLEPVSGPRPLIVTGTAIASDGGELPAGTYVWRLDGVESAGPRETHGQQEGAVIGCGEHTVTLQLILPDPGDPIDCTNVETGSTTGVVVVWPRISGRLLSADGRGVPGATVTANNGGTTVVTDSAGHYDVDVPHGWSGRITVQTDQYVLDRSEGSYTNVTTDVADQDFEVVSGWVKIAGHVFDNDGEPLAELSLSAKNGGARGVTDPNGYYELKVDLGWTGEVVPDHGSHVFDPPRRSYAKLVSNQTGQDYWAGPFAMADALAMMQALPTYSGGPRILLLKNTSYWIEAPLGRALLCEMARVCGGLSVGVDGVLAHGVDSPRIRLAIELAEQGVPIWLAMGSIGGFGTYASIEALDPNYLHDTPQPHEAYLNPEHPLSKPSRRLVCAARHATRRQIARAFAAGEVLRRAGLDAQNVAGLFIHDEIACVAGGSEGYYVYETLYTQCAACGSVEQHDRGIAELQADIVHAMLRGLGAELAGDLNRDRVADERDLAIYQQAVQDQDPIGDLNNDGRVDGDDVAVWSSLPPTTLGHVERFWWSGGWRWNALRNRYDPSPWLPTETSPDVPQQTYTSFSNYGTNEAALTELIKSIEYNQSVFGRGVVPFLSLTYDGTAQKELGVDPELNRQKARAAADRGCPLIWCYALNPPYTGWMTPELFRSQFENLRAIIEGSR